MRKSGENPKSGLGTCIRIPTFPAASGNFPTEEVCIPTETFSVWTKGRGGTAQSRPSSRNSRLCHLLTSTRISNSRPICPSPCRFPGMELSKGRQLPAAPTPVFR